MYPLLSYIHTSFHINELIKEKMKQFSLLIVAVVLTISTAFSQIHNPVKWTVATKKINAKEAVVFIKANIQSGWHIYGQSVPNGGPIPTTITIKPTKAYSLHGKVAESVKPKSKYEEVFKMNVPYFNNEVVFQQKINLLGKGPVKLTGEVEFMACDKTQCLPPDTYNFTVTIK